MEYERKSLPFTLKADAEGAFRAVFSTFDVVDHDGDVTRPGAFKDGVEVIVGSWGHKYDELPVGKGVIRSNAAEAVVDGGFFLDTQPGKDTYQTVKNLGPLGEWSYIFNVTKQSFGEFEGRQVRFIEGVDVFSVDPVLVGAGIGTRTADIKAQDLMTLTESGEALLVELDAYELRLKDRAAFRVKEGRMMSAANMQRMTAIADAMESNATEMRRMIADMTPPPKADDLLVSQFMRYQRNRAALAGVA